MHAIAGGPGGSGLQAVSDNKDLLLGTTGGEYDIISWDPRGVGNLTMSVLSPESSHIQSSG